MPERPHSRKVKIEEGAAEVKKGEKISSDLRASEMEKEIPTKKQAGKEEE